LVGLPFQGLVLLSLWLVAQSVDVHAPFVVLAASLPPVFIISALPVSIGGFGVREVSYVVLLGHAGISSTSAATLSLLYGLSFTAATLPGAIMLFVSTEDRSLRKV
jgi:hypothetical protein